MSEPSKPLVMLSTDELAKLVRDAVRAEMANAQPERDVLTSEQAADLLQISVASVGRYIKREALPAHRMGAEWRFRRADLLAWLDERRVA